MGSTDLQPASPQPSCLRDRFSNEVEVGALDAGVPLRVPQGFVFTSAEGKAVAPELLSPPLPTGACPFGSRPEALSMYEPPMRGTSSSALSVPRSAAHVRGSADRSRCPPQGDSRASGTLDDHADVRPLRASLAEPRRTAAGRSGSDDPICPTTILSNQISSGHDE